MSTEPEYSDADIAAGRRLFGQTWHFVKGVVGLEHLPEGSSPEVAFAGRSNVGKSSLLNALTNQHGLARTSNTPGRTQEINFFRPETGGFFLVDMPGYGYAEAPKDKVEVWQKLISNYLKGRAALARVFVLVDSRHGVKTADTDVMTLLDQSAVSYQIVLTKADKVSVPKLGAIREAVRDAGRRHPACHPHILATSSQIGTGIEALRAEIAALVGFGA